MEEPIVITGAGIVSAIGVGMKETLASLKAGKTGIGEMKYLTSRHRDLPVGEVPLSNAEMMKMLGVEDDMVPYFFAPEVAEMATDEKGGTT